MRSGRAARAVCVPAGGGPSGLRAGGAGGDGGAAVEVSGQLRDLLEQISAINLELLARRELD